MFTVLSITHFPCPNPQLSKLQLLEEGIPLQKKVVRGCWDVFLLVVCGLHGLDGGTEVEPFPRLRRLSPATVRFWRWDS